MEVVGGVHTPGKGGPEEPASGFLVNQESSPREGLQHPTPCDRLSPSHMLPSSAVCPGRLAGDITSMEVAHLAAVGLHWRQTSARENTGQDNDSQNKEYFFPLRAPRSEPPIY